jgi:ubiquinone/menaquinone biosynthesis C-methylase UbiE
MISCYAQYLFGSGKLKSKSSDFSAASGSGYELQMGRFSRLLAPKFLDLIELEDSGKILDAGCGTGALTSEILRRTETANITGIDISEAYVEYAAREISDPRVSFEVADMNALPMPDETFDHIVSQLALNFVPNTSVAIYELSRILKPGGRLAAAIWDVRGGLVFNRLFLDTAAMLDPEANELRKKNFTRPLTRPGHLEDALKSAGFAEILIDETHIRTEFASFEDYWRPFDGKDGPIPSYLSKRPAELKNQIKDAVRDAYMDGEVDGPRSYVATAWVATGRRQ